MMHMSKPKIRTSATTNFLVEKKNSIVSTSFLNF